MVKRRILISTIAIVVILAASLILSNFFISLKPDPPHKPPEDIKRLVKTEKVIFEDVKASIEAPGRLVSNQIVDIISEVQGKILSGDVPLKKGQRFTKGDILLKIFDVEQALSLKASKSRFLNSLANALPDIKFDYPDKYDAVLDFFQSISINKPLPVLPEIKDKSLKIFLASRDVLNQYYTINASEERLKKYSIYAPFNGTYSDVFLEVASIANPGSRIGKIIQTDMLELEVPVEVEGLFWVKIGDRVKVLDETRTRERTGKVVRIGQFVDPGTQSASVFVSITNNPENPVYAGMYMIAVFAEKIISEAMEIPRQAVFNNDEIFLVIDGALKKQKINIIKIKKNTLIFNGIDEGLEIVVEPLINVVEGTKVETTN